MPYRINFVKLTSFKTKEPFYVNLDQVTHIYKNPPKEKGDDRPRGTAIVFQGMSTGNADVVEDAEEILQLEDYS